MKIDKEFNEKLMFSFIFMLMGGFIVYSFIPPLMPPCPDCICNCNVSLKEEPCKKITCANFSFGIPKWPEWEPFIWNTTNETFTNGTFNYSFLDTIDYCKPKPYNCTLVPPDDANKCCQTHCLGSEFNRVTQKCEGTVWMVTE